MNYYTKYENKTEEIIVSGNAIKCATFLKIKIELFSRIQNEPEAKEQKLIKKLKIFDIIMIVSILK